MLLFSPLLFLFLCSVLTRRYFENWRVAIVFAAIITATALTAITEILSLIDALSFYPLMISWLFFIVAAGTIGRTQGPPLRSIWPHVNFKTWFLSEKILLGSIVFIGAVSAVTAAVGTPNTWDAMTYHLPRVLHWIQNKTVGFYPTNIIRQLYIPPWSEFAIAHLRILGGGETSANFIQWTAMAGSLIGVSLVARQLGGNRTGQLMAVTVAACLPMGILQSVSTQTDYTCAFWLIAFVFFIIETQRRFTFVNVIAAGLSLGLGMLTKGNSYIFAAPFLVWFVGARVQQKFTQGLRGLLLILICAVGLNFGQYVRNAQAFGSPTWTNVVVTNGSFSPSILWVNILRNTGIHLATPWEDVNEKTAQTIIKAAQFFKADINDPLATFGGNFSISRMVLDEDYAGNFLHAMLFAVIFVLSWFYRGPRGKIGFYVGAVTFSFLLFCSIVRFQPWHSRFHLPLFILFCPVAGVVLEHFLKQKSFIIGIVLAVGTLPWLFLNDQHPWVGNWSIWHQPKIVQHFYKHPDLALPYAATVGYLKSIDCRQVGLFIGEDTWEYPWWVFLADKGVRIEHVQVNNPSASLKYPLGDFQACAIIASGVQVPPVITMGNATYGSAGQIPAGDDKITVFLRKP